MPTREPIAASRGGEHFGPRNGRGIGVFMLPAAPAEAKRPELVVVEAHPEGPPIEQQIKDALGKARWYAKRNIVTTTIGNPPQCAAERPRRRQIPAPATTHRNAAMACTSVTTRTASTVLVRPRHIAPRQRGAGRPAGSRSAAARSRSSGGSDSSDPGDGEPAEGRHESSARVQP